MVNRSPWRIAVLLLGLWLAPVLPVSAGIIADPMGDTFNSGTHDILGTEFALGPVTSVITVQFAGPIAAPSDLAPNSVTGYIDIDTFSGPGGTAPWGNVPVAGGNNWINWGIANFGVPGPTVDLGSEFYIDLSSELFQPGLVDVLETDNNTIVGTAAVTYVGNTMTITLSSSLIGSPAGARYGVLVGDFNDSTDRAPNGDAGLVATPEPSTMVLAGAFGLGALAYRLRRRRAA